MSLGSITDDIVELHILAFLEKLKSQNKRYKDIIEKTRSWTDLKKIEEWKAFDFYHYFCKKYVDKYDKEYKLNGSVTRAYSRIVAFLADNNIKNDMYKEFISLAFSRHFNVIFKPVLGNICSVALYDKLMGHVSTPKVRVTADDLSELDRRLAKENEKFEKEIQEKGICY